MHDHQTSAAEIADEVLRDCFVSDTEFRNLIDQRLKHLTADELIIRLEVSSRDGSIIAVYGTGDRPGSNPFETRTLLDGGDSSVTCRCEIWRLPGSSGSRPDPDTIVRTVTPLLERHWGARDTKTMLPNLKLPGVPQRFAAAARRLANTGSPIAVLHTDLDHFKKVNSEFGEPTGDKALRVFADRFREAFEDCGVTVRTGGDEFSALLDCSDLGMVLTKVDGLRRRMETETIAPIKRTNTCSIGLSIYPDAENFALVENEDDILFDARIAEQRAKDDGHNRISLSGPVPPSTAGDPITAGDLLEAALTARRIGQGSQNMSESFLTIIRSRLVEALLAKSDIEATIGQVRNGFSLLIGNFEAESARPRWLLGIISSLDWATMVTGALLEATLRDGQPLLPLDRLVLTADAAGILTLKTSRWQIPLGCSINVEKEISADVGKAFYYADKAPPDGIGRKPSNTNSADHDAFSPILLLPIGDVAKHVADKVRHLVAAVIDVDDRPTRGGGLPDFWQSNVSRSIRAALANPNISTVLAIGDIANARLTAEKLRANEASEGKELQDRLSMKADHIDAFLSRHLVFLDVAATRDAVLAAIGEIVSALEPVDFTTRPSIDLLGQARRRLAIAPPDQTHRLAITDGLRTRSLADAYPEALQLIRGPSEGFDQQEALRGTFRELTCFKIVLTDPLIEKVPDYWRKDQQLLNSYFDEVFEKPDGLFGRSLQHPYGVDTGDNCSMTRFAVQQVADATIRRTPTRRINLPILPDSLDQPLGLSSVQLMPRVRGGSEYLDAIWVWRTVDALVGFPFSAYGSIQWSESFLVATNEELSRRGAPALRMGTLTYIALSFHMYLHEGDVEIARTIVQDASL